MNVGDTIKIPYPFCLEEVELSGDDGEGNWGSYKTKSWIPKTRSVLVYPDDAEEVADGIGEQILTIVGIYQPTGFPTRVFFTRKWKDPDGKEFGKNKCHIKTKASFTKLTKGFAYPFRVLP